MGLRLPIFLCIFCVGTLPNASFGTRVDPRCIDANKDLAAKLDDESNVGLPRIPGVKFHGNTEPAFEPVRAFLRSKSANWYSISIPLDPALVDPIYRSAAAQMGGHIFLGGGSDLIEVAVHQDAKLASPNEINAIFEHNVYTRAKTAADVENFEKQLLASKEFRSFALMGGRIFDHLMANNNRVVSVQAPAFKGRSEVKRDILVNGESGADLINYVRNAEEGKFLIDGNPNINVPFKHGHIVRVDADGSATLYFRTRADYENYVNKRLTLPDEDHYPKDWFARITDSQRHNCLMYAIFVYARSRRNGWRYSEKSMRIIREWVDYFPPKERALAKNPSILSQAKRQGIADEDIQQVLREFGLSEAP